MCTVDGCTLGSADGVSCTLGSVAGVACTLGDDVRLLGRTDGGVGCTLGIDTAGGSICVGDGIDDGIFAGGTNVGCFVALLSKRATANVASLIVLVIDIPGIDFLLCRIAIISVNDLCM